MHTQTNLQLSAAGLSVYDLLAGTPSLDKPLATDKMLNNKSQTSIKSIATIPVFF